MHSRPSSNARSSHFSSRTPFPASGLKAKLRNLPRGGVRERSGPRERHLSQGLYPKALVWMCSGFRCSNTRTPATVAKCPSHRLFFKLFFKRTQASYLLCSFPPTNPSEPASYSQGRRCTHRRIAACWDLQQTLQCRLPARSEAQN